jgi:hypothetical protein
VLLRPDIELPHAGLGTAAAKSRRRVQVANLVVHEVQLI